MQPWATAGEADLEDLATLLAGEGWTFTVPELRRLLATAPGLSPLLREDGQVVAGLTVTGHGRLAWIGNVAVRPTHRGKGLGEALVAEALRRIDAAGIPTTGLCSVPRAVTLYQRLGFLPRGSVRTFAKYHDRPTHRPREAELLFPEDLDDLAALDQAAFGAERRALLDLLLREYPDTGAGLRVDGTLVGFGFLRSGYAGSEVGPVVTAQPDPAALALLLDAVLGFRLEGNPAAVECSTWADHPHLPALLEQRGFAERTRSTLMHRGAPLRQDLVRCAALAGLEKG